ncbi:hypothetical protein K439DRAFT_1615896 [Ramaria rubella]|nr:hypothetical protein K439DRAFT_1615896 [Ramaria rubella]
MAGAAASSARARRVGAAVESELDVPGGEVVRCMGPGERGGVKLVAEEDKGEGGLCGGGGNPEWEELQGGDLDHYHGVVLEHGGHVWWRYPWGGGGDGGRRGMWASAPDWIRVWWGGPERKLRVSSMAGHFERWVEEKLRMVMLGEVARWTAWGY